MPLPEHCFQLVLFRIKKCKLRTWKKLLQSRVLNWRLKIEYVFFPAFNLQSSLLDWRSFFPAFNLQFSKEDFSQPSIFNFHKKFFFPPSIFNLQSSLLDWRSFFPAFNLQFSQEVFFPVFNVQSSIQPPGLKIFLSSLQSSIFKKSFFSQPSIFNLQSSLLDWRSFFPAFNLQFSKEVFSQPSIFNLQSSLLDWRSFFPAFNLQFSKEVFSQSSIFNEAGLKKFFPSLQSSIFKRSFFSQPSIFNFQKAFFPSL